MTQPMDIARERARIETTLQRDGFRSLVDQVLDYAVFLISPDAHAVSWNLGVQRVLGYDEAEFLGLPSRAMFTEEDQARGVAETELAEARRCGRASDDRWMRKQDGTRFWANGVTTALRDEGGELVGYTKVMRDMTAEKEAEDRVREADKLHAIGRLAGGVAHEVNNMMTVVGGFGELLLGERELGETARGFVDEIVRACGRATAVTRQLLAYSRRQMLRTEEVRLSEVVEGLESVLRRVLGDEIALHVEADEPCTIVADRGQLEQALLNLAFNARDAMPNGGQLSVQTRRVQVDPATLGPAPHLGDEEVRPGSYALLVVTDTGEGIAPETLPQIFEPFFTTKPIGRGTGLGLSMVHGIVRQSGGFLRVTSEVGRGTTFRLYFPEAATAPRQVSGVTQPGVEALAVPRWPAGTTVLLVEDEPMVRALARRQLEALGLQVIEAADGLEALQVVEKYPGRVDLLLTDVVMPRMAGRELAERLRQWQPDLPVLYMSGYTEDEVVVRGILAAGVEFLPKPFLMQQLSVAIAKSLTVPGDKKPEDSRR